MMKAGTTEVLARTSFLGLVRLSAVVPSRPHQLRQCGHGGIRGQGGDHVLRSERDPVVETGDAQLDEAVAGLVHDDPERGETPVKRLYDLAVCDGTPPFRVKGT